MKKEFFTDNRYRTIKRKDIILEVNAKKIDVKINKIECISVSNKNYTIYTISYKGKKQKDWIDYDAIYKGTKNASIKVHQMIEASKYFS
jgi:hypothetical protein